MGTHVVRTLDSLRPAPGVSKDISVHILQLPIPPGQGSPGPAGEGNPWSHVAGLPPAGR